MPRFPILEIDAGEIVSNRLSRDYGYTAAGDPDADPWVSAVTEKYDDVANTWTAKANLNTATGDTASFSLNGYGYSAGGHSGSAITEKYDGVANTWTAKANLNTARDLLSGFSLNGYGYTTGGFTAANSAVTEKYDDVANTWTAKANLNTARKRLAGFNLNGYGYTAGGYIVAVSADTEKYDDVANTWTAKADLNTARNELTGFSLNGYGYTAGGDTNVVEKYDDVANTWTAKANLNTARASPSGFNLNGYGYTAGGYAVVVSAVTEKYDDVANTWTAKANLNTARYIMAGFALGAIHAGVQNPEIIPILRTIRDAKHPRVAEFAISESMLSKPSVDNLNAHRIARATYDFSEFGGAVGVINLGINLPDNAIATRAYYEVLTVLTSGTSTATVSIDIAVNDVAGLLAATIITNMGTAGYHECIQDGTAANFSEKTTAARALQITIAEEALTEGKFIVFCEYMVSD